MTPAAPTTKSAVELRCEPHEAATPLEAALSETEWVADLQRGSLVTAELSEAVGSTVERAVEPQKPLETTQPPATSLEALGAALGSPALSAQSLGNMASRALASDPSGAYDMPFGWHLFNDPKASEAFRAPRMSAAAVAAPEATADETRPTPSTSTATITAIDASTGTTKRVVELRCEPLKTARPLKATSSAMERITGPQHSSLEAAELPNAAGSAIERAVERQKPLGTGVAMTDPIDDGDHGPDVDRMSVSALVPH